jgi:hypothetical protein
MVAVLHGQQGYEELADRAKKKQKNKQAPFQKTLH